MIKVLESIAPKPIRFLLKQIKMDAIVLFSRVYYLKEPESYSLHLRLHEVKHCHQWESYGIAFPFLYLSELMMVGYKNNKFELEAEAFARMKKAEKNLYVETYTMSNTDYVIKCYLEG